MSVSVEEMREYYNSFSHLHSLSFDELFDLFSSDCNSFASIGRIANLSRERVRQIYHCYFKPLFPNRPSGRKRQKFCKLKRTKVLETNLGPSDDNFVGLIARIADEKGIGFKLKVRKSKLHVRNSIIFLNRKLCKIKVSRDYGSKHGNPHRYRWYIRSERNQPDFYILLGVDQSQVNALYIVPHSEIPKSGDIRTTENSSSNSRLTKYNWTKYKDAWFLLE